MAIAKWTLDKGSFTETDNIEDLCIRDMYFAGDIESTSVYQDTANADWDLDYDMVCYWDYFSFNLFLDYFYSQREIGEVIAYNDLIESLTFYNGFTTEV